MTPMRWIGFAALLAVLVALQHFGLERTPEKREEAVYTNVSDLPPGDMVPTYLGSLFLGSFRAIAIDVLWIQLKDAQDGRRWYLAREIAEMISKLQPRNEEVWAMLAWEFSYNAANGEQDEEKAWQWTRYGILKLREGIRRNPNSPYLRYELARFLFHKPTWQAGRLDVGLLQRIEADDELQREVQDVAEVRVRRSAFELAIRWYEDTVRVLEGRRGANLYHTTQMGLNIHTDTMRGFIRDALFFQAIYTWKLAQRSAESPEWERSKEWFRRAIEHIHRMREKHGSIGIEEDFLELYTHMEDVLDASREYVRTLGQPDAARRDEARLRYVQEMEAILKALGRVEQDHLWEVLSPAKRDLSQEDLGAYLFRDPYEFNDVDSFATVMPRRTWLVSNLKPGPGDVDKYVIYVQAEDDGHGHGPGQFHGRPVYIELRAGRVPLRVRVTSSSGEIRKSIEIPASRSEREEKLEFVADRPGAYFVDVRAIPGSGPLPADTRYAIAMDLGE